MPTMARLSRIVLAAAACSLLLLGIVCESLDQEATIMSNNELSRRVSSVFTRIERLDDKLNETWSRVRSLQTTRDADELLLPGENGIGIYHIGY